MRLLPYFGAAGLLALVAACSSSGSSDVAAASPSENGGPGTGPGGNGDGGAGPDGASGADAEPPVVPGTHFASAALSWNVSDVGASTGPRYPERIGSETWSLIDMDGDRRPDLVSSGRYVANGSGSTLTVWGEGTASPYWKVYANTGKGFSATAKNWPVSDVGASTGVRYPERIASETWSLIDMDGDRKPDLVSSGRYVANGSGSTLTVWGDGTATPYWKVYTNTGSGFSPTAKTWAVRDVGASTGTRYPERIASETWSAMDIDGDGKPDLVSSGRYVPNGSGSTLTVWGDGTASPYWKVYTNTGAGFSATAKTWAVSDVGASTGARYPERIASERWSTMDIDGDGKLDLVSSGRYVANGSGSTLTVWGDGSATPYWKVYANTGSGFAATAKSWPVSDVGASTGAARYPERIASETWAAMDIDGDGKLDLVSSGRYVANGSGSTLTVWGDGTAKPYWKVYANTGSGFTPTAKSWSVSDVGASTGAARYPERIASETWAVIDLDGDRRPDLVSSGRYVPNGSGSTLTVWGDETATPFWKVYVNEP